MFEKGTKICWELDGRHEGEGIFIEEIEKTGSGGEKQFFILVDEYDDGKLYRKMIPWHEVTSIAATDGREPTEDEKKLFA